MRATASSQRSRSPLPRSAFAATQTSSAWTAIARRRSDDPEDLAASSSASAARSSHPTHEQSRRFPYPNGFRTVEVRESAPPIASPPTYGDNPREFKASSSSYLIGQHLIGTSGGKGVWRITDHNIVNDGTIRDLHNATLAAMVEMTGDKEPIEAPERLSPAPVGA